MHLIGTYGAPRLDVHQTESYVLDVLPKLNQVLAQGPHLPNTGFTALDPVLSHWRVVDLYVGQAVEGATEIRTEFSGIDLVGHGDW